jgi:subtilisin-like proprotein convertase family protein
MELRGGNVNGDQQEVFQRIRNSAGGSRDRTAGFFIFHSGHGHIHFDGYSEYNLRRALPDSNGDGEPELGEIVATGGKVSFCLLDSQVFDNSLPGFRPGGSYHSCGQVQGISVGWEDVYGADLEGQEIDISNVLPGRYFLEAIVDPNNALLEADETNNVGRVLVTIPNTGRLGTYTIQVTDGVDKTGLDFGNFQFVTITGQLFEDHDGDGVQEEGDQGLADRIVYLDRNNNNQFDQGQLIAQSTDVPKNLPDEGMVTSNLTVVGGGRIVDVNVRFTLNHTYTGEVRVFLVSPQLTRQELIHNRGGNSNNFIDTILDDETTTLIANGTGPFTGRFKPDNPLTAFDGKDAAGVWTLELQDTSGSDVGTLQSWSLEITFEEPHTHTDALGNFAFGALGLGTHRVRQVVPSGWRETTPSPADFVADSSGDALAGLLLGTYNAPPQVVNLQVKAAGQAPVAIPVGSGVQLQPLLLDAKKVILTFSEHVKIKKSDLNLNNVDSFKYDAATFTATWALDRPLRNRAVELNLSDRVKDATNLALDGEWDNPTDLADPLSDTFNSGNGTAGGRFIFRFVVGQVGASFRSDAEIAAALFAQNAR